MTATETERAEIRAEVLDEQGPEDHETLAEAAQMYRMLRPIIEATMTEPDRWDGDESEEFHLGRYVQWLAAEREQVRTEELTAAADRLEAAHPQAAALLHHMADETRTVTEAEAERLANLTDCPNSHNGGLHCLHYREGDAPCCHCQRPNWCPDGGVTA